MTPNYYLKAKFARSNRKIASKVIPDHFSHANSSLIFPNCWYCLTETIAQRCVQKCNFNSLVKTTVSLTLNTRINNRLSIKTKLKCVTNVNFQPFPDQSEVFKEALFFHQWPLTSR